MQLIQRKYHTAGYFTAAILAEIYVGVGVLLVFQPMPHWRHKNSPWLHNASSSTHDDTISNSANADINWDTGGCSLWSEVTIIKPD